MSYNLQTHAPSSKVVYIDSRDAQIYLTYDNEGQPLTSHFQYIFDDSITIKENCDTLISLHSASIPYGFYNMREGINDRLDFRIGEHSTFDSNHTDSYIEVDEGNYTIGSLLERIKQQLENKISQLNLDPNSNVYGKVGNVKFDFSYVKFKQKCLLAFSNDSKKDVEIKFLFSSGENKERAVRAELGLRINDEQGFYIVSPTENRATNELFYSRIINEADPEYYYKFLSPNCIDINNSTRGVYVRTNLTTISTLDTQTGSYSAILARIPIQVNTGGIIFHNPNNSTHKAIIRLPFIKAINIKLTDDRNRLLNMNGLHFSLALQFDFIYRQAPIQELTQIEARMLKNQREDEIIANRLLKKQNKKKKNKS